jgi:hypothetical protein
MLTLNRKWDLSFSVLSFVTSFQTGPFCYWRRRRRDKSSHFCWSTSKDSATWWNWCICHGCSKVYHFSFYLSSLIVMQVVGPIELSPCVAR